MMQKKSRKLMALLCTAAMLSAAGCAGQGGGDTSDTSVKENSSVSSSVEESTESSAESSAESSTESSQESSETSEEKLGWTFREVTKPAIKDAVYTQHPDATEYDDFFTIKPEEMFDYDAAKEAINKTPAFSGLEFMEVVSEGNTTPLLMIPAFIRAAA